MSGASRKPVQKVVLAYSGGLDTSVCIPWLRETYGCQVIAMVADVGQQEDLVAVAAKARQSGAAKVYVEDLRDTFVEAYLLPMVRAGAVYEGKYLLGTAIARPLIARRQVEVARQEGADAVAHGATGKGNDQVRFELTYKALAPDLRVIAPWREWHLRGRSDCIEYARARGIPVPVSREKPYSMDRNLWHVSYEAGQLEDPWTPPEAGMFLWTRDPASAPDSPATVTLGFERGVPTSLDGRRLSPRAILESLNEVAALHGVGRVDMVENRLVGMKSRGVYETPGGTVLSTAYRELESLVLDRETAHFKELLALRYAELVYYGLWFTPLRQALDAFVDVLRERVTGEVRLQLFKGAVRVLGRRSPFSLYQRELASFEGDSLYNQADATGFINLFGLPLAVQGLYDRERALEVAGVDRRAEGA